MTVARYWGSISNKTKILFKVLAKKTQATFIILNDSNYKKSYNANEKNVFVLEKSITENYRLQNEIRLLILRRNITCFISLV